MFFLKKVGLFFLDFIETIVISLSIFVLIYIFLFQPHQVKGNSMLPNFKDGEYLLTNKITYRFNEPQRGDVIVFKAPQNEDYDYIKRIIGLPGDTVTVKNGKIMINDSFLDESAYLEPDVKTKGGRYAAENSQTQLREGEYFAVGDNRNHSSDSRDWGPVEREAIVGKAWLVYWPLNQIRTVEEVVYATN